MKKMILVAGLVAACTAPAQFLQNLTQAVLQPEPAPAAQPQPVRSARLRSRCPGTEPRAWNMTALRPMRAYAPASL